MLDFVVYLLYRLGSAIIGGLPLPLLFVTGQFLGFFAWIVLGKYRRLALRNLAIAFGEEKSPLELRQLGCRHFQRLGANLLCSVKLTQMSPEKILHRVTVENIEAMGGRFRAGIPVVLVLSHLGIWELFAQLMPKFVGYVRNASVYQRLGNRFIDEHVRRTRSRTGLELFDRKDGFQPVIELLRSGGGVGVLCDQHAGDHGVWTPFFGRLASTSPLAALLAKRTRAALVAAGVYTDGLARWRMVFIERFDTADASAAALTSKINQIIEQQIRRAPEDWFWVHNRWKTPRPHFLLSQYKRGVYLPDGPAAARTRDLKPFRILIRSGNWLGDGVMSAPAVRAIKSGRPDAQITIAAPSKIAPMWDLIPEVDAVITFPSNSLLAATRLIRRQPSFDVAILFPNSLRAALEVYLSGVARRVGYRGHSRRWLLNQLVREPEKPAPLEHQSNRYLRIAQACGAERSNVEHRTSNAKAPNPNQTSDIRHQTFLGLCAGAEYGPAKRWLPERFAEVAAAVTAKIQVHWVLFGTAQDTATGEQISRALGDRCVNRIGQTTLDQFIDELRECRLLLTNDTGTMHLAALLGIPTVAIFGSTEPRLTGPLGNDHIILRHHVECSPCFLRQCPIDFRCMKAISVQEATDAVMSILQKKRSQFGAEID
ncbi:MAG: lipopolysaccharide heptosyltransferase II [Verrucomicrobia bacterium]|nr:MAG: lipopolysaccharide heptosyltransferase II [Verrucomicrobiota bacterium]